MICKTTRRVQMLKTIRVKEEVHGIIQEEAKNRGMKISTVVEALVCGRKKILPETMRIGIMTKKTGGDR
jgi:hypothetical protein